MTNETVLTESPKLYPPMRLNRHGFLGHFLTRMKICPRLRASGRVRGVKRISVIIIGICRTRILMNFIPPVSLVSCIVASSLEDALGYEDGNSGTKKTGLHVDSEDMQALVKRRGSEQKTHSRVSGRRGTSQSQETGAGLQLSCGSGG